MWRSSPPDNLLYGQISPHEICFSTGTARGARDKYEVWRLGNLDDLRRIWEITAKVTVYGIHGRPDTTLGGGKGENPEENWQRLLDIRLNDEEDDEEDV